MIRSFAAFLILLPIAAAEVTGGERAHPAVQVAAPAPRNRAIVCSRRLGPRSYMDGARISEIVLFDATTLAKTVLTRDDYRFMPTGSQDGTRIAYVRPTGPAAFNLFEMDLEGRDIRQLTFLEDGIANTPAYSPDGQWLLYSADHEVQLMDLETLGSTTLTHTTRGTTVERQNGEVVAVSPHSHHASFSPDGREVVYASTQSGDVQVWKMKLDGSAAVQLTDGSHGGHYPHANVPSYSLGVDRIAFWSGFEGNFGEVWLMDRDGGDKRRVTETEDPGNSDDPFLSPDGKVVVFGRGAPGEPRGMYLFDLETERLQLLIDDFQWCNWIPGS